MGIRNGSGKNSRLKSAGMIAMLAAVLWLPGYGLHAQDLPEVLVRPAIMTERAAQSVLLAVSHAGCRLVATGERGIVLLSDDNGMTWRQAKAPVSVTLTAVQFVTPQTGWAVGHCGVVLRSDDGGETWKKQLDGVKAARLVLDSVEKKLLKDKELCVCIPGEEEVMKARLEEAKWLVSDGPDKPFLDLYFENEKNGFIVGAYNLIFRTRDGGESWEPWLHHVENPSGMHLGRILPIGNDIFIVGEQGLVLRSSDGGETFRSLSTPYRGTYLGCLNPKGNLVLIFGLQGNAFLSADRGETWQKVETGVTSSLSAGVKLSNGMIMLVASNGTILASPDSGRTFRIMKKLPLPLAGVSEAADGSVVLAGVRGVVRIPSPSGSGQSGINPEKGAGK